MFLDVLSTVPDHDLAWRVQGGSPQPVPMRCETRDWLKALGSGAAFLGGLLQGSDWLACPDGLPAVLVWDWQDQFWSSSQPGARSIVWLKTGCLCSVQGGV